MTKTLEGVVALVTGASSGIGEATARKLANLGAAVALVARRKDRLDTLVSDIEASGGRGLAIEADITDRAQATAAVERAVREFGSLDILVNSAGLMLIGSTTGADPEEWDRMLQININGLLYVTNAALPHLLGAAERSPRQVADLINVSSVAAFQYNPINGVYAATKVAVNAFSESLRQEVTKRHVRVGVIEPGSVATELASHNRPEIRDKILSPYFNDIETLGPGDIADAIAYMVTRPRRAAVGKIWIGPTEQI
ncbi:SDR family NAD(P)-dependent oxidoreductase [Xanthomonas hortorum]|uniref:SDR family NAD(P)-dependent oxidoreductase n=1 Tax=Xanthomonas hortorum TaxID=56454 RepID=UPI0015936DBB|nr:SDR family NAD(P)-dependent oxidoreductase [Xanthomonas hortorum]NHF65609.1 SDR family NAD(P)-dependent oxidoreductase [Xanthomonas hortorum]